MTAETTVLVIGGGATGAGVARDLSMRGLDVTLVERNALCSGTSGHTHGVLHSGARYAESDPEGAEACHIENQVLRSIAGECIDTTGGLFVELTDDDPAYFSQKRDACESIGIETETLDNETVHDSISALSKQVTRAMTVPDGVIYPSRLVAANAADAEAHGAMIYPQTPVEDLTVRNGRITTAHLSGHGPDRIEPEYVVNATGAWASEIASMAGLTIEMALTRGVMVSVRYDQLATVLNRCRDPDDGDIIVPYADKVVLGTTSVPVSNPDEHPQADWEIETCLEECATMLPPVADAEVERAWWGVRPLYSPDATDSDRRGISRGFYVLDHASAGLENFLSIVGGKLTTYRRMAEAATDIVCDRLGVTDECETADRRLPHVDTPETLDSYVETYNDID